jgi:molybdenum cofactor guanylyltransferase
VKAFTAVLLCGGESRRMGRDKATLEWRGRAMWEWQMKTIRALQPEKIFVSARTDLPWRPDDTELVLDTQPSRGPISGLISALERMRTSHLLVLAIDMPFMKANHLRRLCDAASTGVGVVPFIGERAEPLAAIYPKEALPKFRDATNASLQPLVRKLVEADKLRIMQISEKDARYYKNVNQPSEFRDLAKTSESSNHLQAGNLRRP